MTGKDAGALRLCGVFSISVVRVGLRWPTFAALLALSIVVPPTAEAQGCLDNVTFSGQTGDGSVRLTGASIDVRRTGTTDWSANYSGFTLPSETITCFHPGAGIWDVRARSLGYFDTPAAVAAVSCSAQNVCTGSASFTFYSDQGSISGTVTELPS